MTDFGLNYAEFTPVCTLNATATETTCNYLLKPTTNVTSVAQFVQMNDNVDDKCDNLVIGGPVRVSRSAHVYDTV